MNDSLQGRFLGQLERDPERPSLAFYSGQGEVDWLRRGQVFARAGHMAERLAALGLGVDDTCLVMLPGDEDLPFVILGALMLGSVPLLTAPPRFWEASGELAGFVHRLVEISDASLVIASPPAEGEKALAGLGVECVHPGRLKGSSGGGSTLRLGEAPGELAAMQLTSGTTGAPRICVWRQAEVLAALDGTAAALGPGDDTVYFNWTPLYHDLGLVNCLFYCLAHGIPMTIMDPVAFVSDPALWLRGMSETRATTTWSPNFGYSLAARRARDEHLEGVRLDHVDGFWNAAERVHPSTMRAFHRRFAPWGVSERALRTSYGCAENVGGATFSRPRERPLVEYVDRRRLWEERLASPVPESGPDRQTEPVTGVGSPRAGVEILIVGEDDAALPEGTVGEIHLQSDSMMAEYLGEPEASERATTGGRLRTGDLGYLRGDELFWVGRLRERISIRGLKLDPSIFEEVLLEIPGLREGSFAAFGIDDEQLGTQRLVIVSEVRRSAESEADRLASRVRRRIFDRLEVLVDDLVLVKEGTLRKTSSGKRRNRRCRAIYEAKGFEGLRIGGTADV